MGTKGFMEGKKAPAQCKECLNMIAGRMIGEHPKGEASTVAIFEAWNKGWEAQRRKEVDAELKALGF